MNRLKVGVGQKMMKNISAIAISLMLCGTTTPAQQSASLSGRAIWEQHRNIARARAFTWLRRSSWNSKPWFVDGKSLIYEKGKLVALRYHMAHGVMNVTDSMEQARALQKQRRPNLVLEYSFSDETWKLIAPAMEGAKPRRERLPNSRLEPSSKS